MAKSQINNSKKPMSGAKYLIPLDIKIILIVPRLTSITRAKKIRHGNIIQVKISEFVRPISPNI